MATAVSITDPDDLAVATIRTLAMDAVQAANSGHPGTPMALAPVAYTLWQQYLRFDPADPIWANRDRFVLSAGHASTLLYSLLHLTGVKSVNPHYETLGEPRVPLDDIKRFRQLDSKCPGHPEYRWTAVSSAPPVRWAPGYATSVGMAMASQVAGRDVQPARLRAVRLRRLRDRRRRLHDGGHRPARRHPWPGTSKLANLCWIYDNNEITIEGSTALAFSEDVATRFLGLRLERHHGRRRQRPQDAGRGPSTRSRPSTTDRP